MPGFQRFVGLAVLTCAIGCGGGEDRSADDARDTATSPPPADPGPAPASGGQASTPGSTQSGPVRLSITGTVAGKEYQVAGSGDCTYTKTASIYDVPAAMWSVQYAGAATPVKHFSLTVWRPTAGGSADQFSIHLAAGSESHQINTVKGAKLVGVGTITVQSRNSGGRFEIDGQSAEGSRMHVTVDCERFTEPKPVGG